MDADVSLNDPGNLATNFGATGCKEPDLSLLSSDNILLVDTGPDIDKSAPFKAFGASSRFVPPFDHARW